VNTIKILYINIILSRLGVSNKKGIFESDRKLLHTGDYELDLSISDFEEQLTRTILSHKGDGLNLNIQSTKKRSYVDIELLVGEEDDEPNIEYLLHFLESFKSKVEKQEQTYKLSDFENYIYIECYSSDESELLIKALEKENVGA